MSEKIRVAILGATGAVGQRFVQLLEHHPWFEVTALTASAQSVGKRYGEIVRWHLDTPIPPVIGAMEVEPCEPDLEAELVFSGLDSGVAGPIEEAFAEAGYGVVSNARNHRLDEDVPLLIPEVNPGHLDIIPHQRSRRGYDRGFIVTNPNCTVIGLVMALRPLEERFGLRQVMVTSLQALSGAGYPGIASLDILDNVIPYINGEEPKVEREPLKLLGHLEHNRIVPAALAISAQCNRVAVRDGHLECIAVKLASPAEVTELEEAYRSFRALPQQLGLPSAPDPPIVLCTHENRPQPRLDRDLGNGMAVAVGRIRRCSILDFKLVALVHNTIRGAAGAAILNAELLCAQGYIHCGIASI